jgi:iron(III) transport system ATP-binding protein
LSSAASVRIQGLSKRYPGTAAPAVHDLTLEVEAGEFIALLGPSGCGKTTTLRCVAGLEKPDAGEIWVNDTLVFSSTRRINIPAYRRQMGMVFQSYAIWPHMTVFENVAYPLKNLSVRRSDIQSRVMDVLALVGLDQYATRPAPLLSGGQQQRVALARALVAQPQVLLLDEPLSNLDAKLREQMQFELRDIQQKLGLTAIYVTHDQDEAFSLADVMAVIHSGELLELGTPEEVYEAPATSTGATFLGSTTRVTGVVVGRDGAKLIVRTALGDMRCRSRAEVPDGGSVEIHLRPDDVELVTDDFIPHEGTLILDAELLRTAPRRSVIDCWFGAGAVTLQGKILANTPAGRLLRNGVSGPVRIAITQSRCVPSPEHGG